MRTPQAKAQACLVAQVALTRRVLELTRDAEWDVLEELLRNMVRQQLAALPTATVFDGVANG